MGLKFNPKIGRIHIKRFMEFFLENSFTTVNILVQQKRGVCYLAMSEELGKDELADI